MVAWRPAGGDRGLEVDDRQVGGWRSGAAPDPRPRGRAEAEVPAKCTSPAKARWTVTGSALGRSTAAPAVGARPDGRWISGPIGGRGGAAERPAERRGAREPPATATGDVRRPRRPAPARGRDPRGGAHAIVSRIALMSDLGGARIHDREAGDRLPLMRGRHHEGEVRGERPVGP